MGRDKESIMLEIEVPSSINLDFNKGVVRNVMATIGRVGKFKAQNAMDNSPPTGAAYAACKRTKAGNASSPGAPPRKRTGTLRKDIVVKAKGSVVTLTTKDEAFYSKFLEVGAVGGGGKGRGRGRNKKVNGKVKPVTKRVLLPRPFIRNSLIDAAKEVGPTMVKALEQGLKLKVSRNKVKR
jgi:hypothetical protein